MTTLLARAREAVAAMVAAFLNCQPLAEQNKSARMWQLFVYSDYTPEQMEAIAAFGLRAVLAAAGESSHG